jgi:hypothetical protein
LVLSALFEEPDVLDDGRDGVDDCLHGGQHARGGVGAPSGEEAVDGGYEGCYVDIEEPAVG